MTNSNFLNKKFAHNGLVWHTMGDVIARYKNKWHSRNKESDFTLSYERHTRFEDDNPWETLERYLKENPFPGEYGRRSSKEILKEFFFC